MLVAEPGRGAVRARVRRAALRRVHPAVAAGPGAVGPL